MALVEKAIELNIKNIDLFFELEGLKYWSTGEWKRKTEGTKELYNFMQRAKYKININFIKYNKSVGFLDLFEKEDSNNNNEGVDQEKKVEEENYENVEEEEEDEKVEEKAENNNNNVLKSINITRTKKSSIYPRLNNKITLFELSQESCRKRHLLHQKIDKFMEDKFKKNSHWLENIFN